MSDGEDMNNLEPQRRRDGQNDDLLEEQEGKGYGEDEGEREQALEDE